VNKNGTKILLYEPSGGGGVCQYTDRLASSLVSAGLDVCVAAPEGSELTKHQRQYRLLLLGKRLWLKKILSGPSTSRTNLVSSRITGLREFCFRQLERASRNARFAAIVWGRLKFVLALLLERPDIVHFQWLTDPTEEYRFMRVLRIFGFKLVYTAHNLLPHGANSVEDRLKYRNLYRVPDKLIVHAENSKGDLASSFQIDPDKIAVIPNGVYDFFFDSSQPVSRAAAREQLGIAEHEKVILFFGIIRGYKGLEYLIEAFTQVKARVDNATLLIAGEISRANRQEFAYYTKLLTSLKDRADVRHIDGYIPDSDVGGLFVASDLVVLPYVKTYTSGVLLAAYGAGKPVVATNTGGLGELVEPGKSGLLVPPTDPHALAEAITTMLLNPEELHTMGGYAKHLATTRYSWQRIATQTRDLYQAVITA